MGFSPHHIRKCPVFLVFLRYLFDSQVRSGQCAVVFSVIIPHKRNPCQGISVVRIVLQLLIQVFKSLFRIVVPEGLNAHGVVVGVGAADGLGPGGLHYAQK